MGVLAEVPVTVEVPTDDLSNIGAALAMWTSARDRDQHAGSTVLLALEPSDLVSSAGPLLVWLLRLAGHHHRGAHQEVRDGTLPEDAHPYSAPLMSSNCAPGAPCDCAAESACRDLASIIAGTPAEPVLAQVGAQFADKPARTYLRLTEVTTAQIFVAVEAAAFLAARRFGNDVETIIDQAREHVLRAAAA